MKTYIDNEECNKSLTRKHEMYYDYTYLINWESGFINNIVKCKRCGKQAQNMTMYEPMALHSLSLKFTKETKHLHI
ncbi:MAG: hypothetical protein JETCAE03_32620 [Ignavibacteriaceae bacterium]|jgi:hypothetical protein|nr:MAG: hypothetical protein JETCAE03_32620 [Ignavibacteriaceae bacterium]